jgi:hypothetical protein
MNASQSAETYARQVAGLPTVEEKIDRLAAPSSSSRWLSRELSAGWSVPSRTMPAKKDYRWQIYHIKSTPAKFIGTVTASDEEAALKRLFRSWRSSPRSGTGSWR